MRWIKGSKDDIEEKVTQDDEQNLKIDIDLEQFAIDVYERHAKTTNRPHIKELLEHIIEEEKHHIKEIKKQLEDLDKPLSESDLSRES